MGYLFHFYSTPSQSPQVTHHTPSHPFHPTHPFKTQVRAWRGMSDSFPQFQQSSALFFFPTAENADDEVQPFSPSTASSSSLNPPTMFPKLASGILRGDVSRAALSQSQNSQFRTVLQFSPSYPPSPLPPATPLQPNSLLANTNGAASGSSDGSSRAGGSRNNKFSEGYPVRQYSPPVGIEISEPHISL